MQTADRAQRPLVISIQSQVCLGHVGNSAAARPMRALGIDLIEVPTALLSNHPHYATMRGDLLPPVWLEDLLLGLQERGLLQRASMVLSGFLGSPQSARIVTRFVERAKQINPDLYYACDPVMGDSDLGFFAPEELQTIFRDDLLPLTDCLLPNAFELEALSGIAISDAEAVQAAREKLSVPAILASSVPVPDNEELIASIYADSEGSVHASNQRMDVRPAGTGDLLAGLFIGRLAMGAGPITALSKAVQGVAVALKHTDSEQWAEMPIDAYLDEIIAPRD
ncbi:pyridoxal kinase [Cohaesibacter gelatinilyticus]|uniref:pyridoxal kinase n=1 Tax=Cohaesibacter gelatinilyticus TaxID=372072 RepID=A0A285PIH1_9HYPH|nr:pyridoxal kinase [Cohaesibacter gelatinilyticus]SNZ19661.1 Pyridoxal kinase [Cohaesibacter gelatinilyticus]